MSIEEYIQKAIEGGWGKDYLVGGDYVVRLMTPTSDVTISGAMNQYSGNYHSIFLDPKSWEAVGKIEGWNQGELGVCSMCGARTPEECVLSPECVTSDIIDESRYKMHGMVDHLCNGGTIESFLERL